MPGDDLTGVFTFGLSLSLFKVDPNLHAVYTGNIPATLVTVMDALVADLAEGQNDLAQQRMEDLICLNAASVAALTHLPITCISCGDGKRKVQTRDTLASE